MNVRNCRKCGRIFNYSVGVQVCPRCREKMEEKFQEVKQYIYDHKGADVQEVSEACDVEQSQIRQWVREDRLQFSDDCPISLPCERCGRMIKSGRYCAQCNNELVNGLNSGKKGIVNVTSEQNKKKASDRDRMRFL